MSYGKPETGHWAIWLGCQVYEGKITRDENDRRMVDLLAWDKGGERPEWMPPGDPPKSSVFKQIAERAHVTKPRSEWEREREQNKNHLDDRGAADAAR